MLFWIIVCVGAIIGLTARRSPWQELAPVVGAVVAFMLGMTLINDSFGDRVIVGILLMIVFGASLVLIRGLREWLVSRRTPSQTNE